ncbi:hypothetical protein [Plebeiibacterium sediminum]|uniref:DUF3592 domain-containing protein n=1 Tax=Plebeiibacterium sediminum TaxID=2992112 RepID=A0AAE3SIH0_9BACT|nr:hypothetical protein [Plebeiobacterium sediminum]MCW3789228.1 hypothetical protein [Plebeiobacterium sediminum]
MKEKNIVIVGTVILAVCIMIVLRISVNKSFDKYFDDVDRAVGVTTETTLKANGTGINVHYLYRIGKTIYKGSYSTKGSHGIKVPKGKYLVVYSRKNPVYNAFVPVLVNQNLKDIQVDSLELKKRFDLTTRAKIVRK